MPKKKELFSENLKELEKIASELNSGTVEIEEAISLYKKGKILVASMKEYLKKVEKEISVIDESLSEKQES